jgi:hypothetical protein
MSNALLSLHPVVALSDQGGFIPAIKVVNALGEHVSVYRPEGAAAEYRTFTRHTAALADAWVIARRVANARPHIFRI